MTVGVGGYVVGRSAERGGRPVAQGRRIAGRAEPTPPRPSIRSFGRALIEKIFFDRHAEGANALEFTRQEMKDAAADLGIAPPDNLGDTIYSFRFRTDLPRA